MDIWGKLGPCLMEKFAKKITYPYTVGKSIIRAEGLTISCAQLEMLLSRLRYNIM